MHEDTTVARLDARNRSERHHAILTPPTPHRIQPIMLRHLEAIAVEKPWGRTDIPLDFGDFDGRRIGEIWFTRPDNPDAPIMIKFLFTSERLSIQVHPGDDAAQAAGYPRGKDECWLVDRKSTRLNSSNSQI